MFRKSIFAIGASISIIALMAFSAEAAEKKTPAMNDLESVNELRTQFNSDKGKRRLLLLLSPT
jgi:hypothetical protein